MLNRHAPYWLHVSRELMRVGAEREDILLAVIEENKSMHTLLKALKSGEIPLSRLVVSADGYDIMPEMEK